MLDLAIGTCSSFARQQILGGWRRSGRPTGSGTTWASPCGCSASIPRATPLLRRVPARTRLPCCCSALRLVRGTIGGGGFFFICLGPATGTLGDARRPDLRRGEPGELRRLVRDRPLHAVLVGGRGRAGGDADAAESSHNFANFIRAGHREREGIRRLLLAVRRRYAAGVDESDHQRVDLCGDP